MNFKHLHYFWAAAKAGGIVRASEQLHITPQTLSGQIKLLEESLGCSLFQKRGRGLELTPEGRTALSYADQIFALGSELEAALGSRGEGARALDFRVGIADAVPKSIAYRLLEPALGIAEPVRLICHEGNFRDLLGQLSVQRIDLVIADEPMGPHLGVKAFNHTLGTTAMSFFATAALKRSLKGEFPACLDRAPMLIQGASSAARQRLDLWLAEHRLRPRPIGEFDDAALLKAFGGEGRGVFMTPEVLEEETCTQYGVEVIGRAAELIEEFFAISVERRITHPCVVAITKAARGRFHRRRGSA
ncbi:transcriptional activator NhaR [Variovorax saccharolyticus]|uniref:transcriptional activator NhaR n=1 Tax=Variovorax saccharolyticus TaxID=3053516 RepID=UPI002578B19F|nr:MULTISPECIES: transcriptional activator NhaR [unclassified Variovorax]MDM0019291.1 transcriptional activator NhaR [Variovorax sp. J22R187]MDM0026162.1 transcriptional activator NhaR [Variovorax sp. J31P216]